jgi:2-methylcitrate dehydratase PrpD
VSDVTAELAAFLVDAPVSDDERHAARRALATAVPLAVGAIGSDAPARVERVVRALGGRGVATVLGAELRTSPSLAALVNGTAANSDDFDDTDLTTAAHPSASVVPAALAVAEHVDASLGTLLDAIAVGNEVATRLARAFGAEHVRRGWHISSTSNQIGASAASTVVLGLGERHARRVLGLAATQVAGLGAALGTMTKPFHFGKAASNGVEAAQLVAAGLTAPERGIDGRRGLLPVVAPHADAAAIVDGLGTRWMLHEVMPKPYPCGYVSHAAIDAAIDLHRSIDDLDGIVRIGAQVSTHTLDFMDRPSPSTPLEAKLSVQYCIAAAIRRGRLGLAEFQPDAVGDRTIRALMAMVEPVGDRAAVHTARLTAQSLDGSIRTAEVTVGRGTLERSLTDAAVAAKGVEAAARTLGDDAAAALVDACLGGADDVSVRQLTALAGGQLR